MHKKKLVLVKLGGSLITNKAKENSVRENKIEELLGEITRAKANDPHLQIILGHGHGSVGHVVLKKYELALGRVEEKRKGIAETLERVTFLNNLFIKKSLQSNLLAVSMRLAAFSTLTNKTQEQVIATIETLLDQDFLPITCGDIIFINEDEYAVWSTEKVFSYLVSVFEKSQRYKIERTIHVTQKPGFLDSNGSTIKNITKKTWDLQKKHLFQTNGIDATGGMKHKVEESLSMTENGISSLIISGEEQGNLYNALLNKNWKGSLVTK